MAEQGKMPSSIPPSIPKWSAPGIGMRFDVIFERGSSSVSSSATRPAAGATQVPATAARLGCRSREAKRQGG